MNRGKPKASKPKPVTEGVTDAEVAALEATANPKHWVQVVLETIKQHPEVLLSLVMLLLPQAPMAALASKVLGATKLASLAGVAANGRYAAEIYRGVAPTATVCSGRKVPQQCSGVLYQAQSSLSFSVSPPGLVSQGDGQRQRKPLSRHSIYQEGSLLTPVGR